jgi:DNA cross-link repair 1C protein
MSTRPNLPAEIQTYIRMVDKALTGDRDMTIVDELDLTDGDTALPILKSLFKKVEAMTNPLEQGEIGTADSPLPNVIRFPYARHSSLPELRDFVGALKPKEIVPCTYNAGTWLQKGWTIGGLFGDCCSGTEFEYDKILETRAEECALLRREGNSSPLVCHMSTSQISAGMPIVADSIDLILDTPTPTDDERETQHGGVLSTDLEPGPVTKQRHDCNCTQKSENSDNSTDLQGDSQRSLLSEHAYETRRNAYEIAKANLAGETWGTVGLISTTDHHTTVEEELGQP